MASKATQQAQTQDFIDDMMAFTSASIQWCSEESEKAAKSVGDTIHFLMNDAKRISSMSEEALSVLKDFRAKVTAPKTSMKATDLIAALNQLAAEESDVLNLANPVIEALQFQDRVTQQMENMVSMIAAWASQRSAVAQGPVLSEADRIAFGEVLLKCTTMQGERDIIRSVIPELPEEEKAEQVKLF